MAKEKYIKPVEEKLVVNEPMAAYQQTSHGIVAANLSEAEIEVIKCSKEQIVHGEYFTQEEVDKQAHQWLG